MTLIPPPVEPAQPPTKLDKTNKAGRKVGHKSKAALEKPVILPIETDSNKPYLMQSAIDE